MWNEVWWIRQMFQVQILDIIWHPREEKNTFILASSSQVSTSLLHSTLEPLRLAASTTTPKLSGFKQLLLYHLIIPLLHEMPGSSTAWNLSNCSLACLNLPVRRPGSRGSALTASLRGFQNHRNVSFKYILKSGTVGHGSFLLFEAYSRS